MSDDVHNPFGGNVPAKKRRQHGIFDPDRRGDDDDPFKPEHEDSEWDEPEEPSSSKDV